MNDRQIAGRVRLGEQVFIAPTAFVCGDVVQSYVNLGREHAAGKFPPHWPPSGVWEYPRPSGESISGTGGIAPQTAP